MLSQYQKTIIEYRKRVFSFAFYSLRNREDAEDITQDVFIKLWQHWHKIDHDRVGAWLMRVARNSVVDHARRHKNDWQRVNTAENLGDRVAEEDPEPEFQEFRQHLEIAISSLNEPYRSILIMRDIQGLSYQEIEQSLDLNQSQVKVYLYRARRQLRENSTLRQCAADQNLLSMAGGGKSKSDATKSGSPVNYEGTSHVR